VTALLLAAVLSCLSPEGQRLSLGSMMDRPSDEVAQAAKMTHLAQGALYVAEHPGYWFKLAWECGDTAVVWPAGRRLVLVTEKGEVESSDILAMSPPLEQRPTKLGNSTIRLNPSDLWRAPYKGNPAVKLFVRFPRLPARPDSVRLTVQPERR